jgi:hypothetical protein
MRDQQLKPGAGVAATSETAVSTPGKQSLVANDDAEATAASAHHKPASKSTLEEFQHTLQRAIKAAAEKGLDKLDPVGTIKQKLDDALSVTSCSQADTDQIASTINFLRLRAAWDMLNGLEDACGSEIDELHSHDSTVTKLAETFINFVAATGTLLSYANAIGEANGYTQKLHARCNENRRRMNPHLQAIPVPDLHYLPHLITTPPDIHGGGVVIVPVPGALVGVGGEGL